MADQPCRPICVCCGRRLPRGCRGNRCPGCRNTWVPTPREIAKRAAAIQAEWTRKEELDHRAVSRVPAAVPVWDTGGDLV
jgi:hypothetical protein